MGLLRLLTPAHRHCVRALYRAYALRPNTAATRGRAPAAGNTGGVGSAVVNVYINYEKKFAFVEMRTVEETSNSMALDGIMFEGVAVRIRRPNDYNPALAARLGPSQPAANMNLAAVNLAGGGMVEEDRVRPLPLRTTRRPERWLPLVLCLAWAWSRRAGCVRCGCGRRGGRLAARVSAWRCDGQALLGAEAQRRAGTHRLRPSCARRWKAGLSDVTASAILRAMCIGDLRLLIESTTDCKRMPKDVRCRGFFDIVQDLQLRSDFTTN